LDLEASADRGEAGLNKIRRAIDERHDEVLGYRSIGDYVADKYEAALTQVCRVFGADFRRDVVRELTDAGMSTRAIAPVVGVSDRMVRKDVTAIRSGGNPVPTSQTETPERKTVTFDSGGGFVGEGQKNELDTRTKPDDTTGEVLTEDTLDDGKPTGRFECQSCHTSHPLDQQDMTDQGPMCPACSDKWEAANMPKTVVGIDGKTYHRNSKPTPNACYPGDPYRMNDFNDALREARSALRSLYSDASAFPHQEKADAMERIANQLLRKAQSTRKKATA